MEWTLSPQGQRWGIRCSYERQVPEPECGACGESDCDLCDGWTPTEHCRRDPRVRVQLEGECVDVCSLEEHGCAGVEWWAPIYGPIYEPPFTQMMKYFYRETAIAELASREHPLLRLLS